MPERDADDRSHNFLEVNMGFNMQDALTEVFGQCDEVAFDVMRAGRQFEYFLYFASPVATSR